MGDMTDEIVEAAKNEWFNPTTPLRDETEGERFKRIVKQAITAALQSAPVSVEREELAKHWDEMAAFGKLQYEQCLAAGVERDVARIHLDISAKQERTAALLRTPHGLPGGVDESNTDPDSPTGYVKGSEFPRLTPSTIGAEGQAVIDAALTFIEHGTKVTKVGGEIAHVVIERADKSDPHYALCKAVEAYRKAAPPAEGK